MSSITYRDGIAIGEIIVYFPALIIGVLLAVRHGFGRSSGWLFLIIFSLVRIIGACFQLATINNPTQVSLYTGAAVLQTIGISPLELVSLGLLGRIRNSISKSVSTFVLPTYIRLIQTMVLVALILSIVGGINASEALSSTGVYTPQALSQAAMGIYIGAYVLIAGITIILSFQVTHAELGEKRLLLAVALALPFILVRLIYGAISIFGNTTNFNSVSGNVTIYLCMALLMELCAIIIYEAVGITLRRIQHTAPATYVRSDGTPVQTQQGPQGPQGPQGQQGPSKASQFASTLGRRTIIGRLITAGMNNGGGDTEMQQPQGGQYQSRRQERRARRHGY